MGIFHERILELIAKIKREFLKDRKVAIIGLGLLRASLGTALQGKGYVRMGWTRRKEIRESQLTLGVIDKTADRIEDLLKKADLTVLCLPMRSAVNLESKSHIPNA